VVDVAAAFEVVAAPVLDALDALGAAFEPHAARTAKLPVPNMISARRRDRPEPRGVASADIRSRS
jgi:hypothetical protein